VSAPPRPGRPSVNASGRTTPSSTSPATFEHAAAAAPLTLHHLPGRAVRDQRRRGVKYAEFPSGGDWTLRALARTPRANAVSRTSTGGGIPSGRNRRGPIQARRRPCEVREGPLQRSTRNRRGAAGTAGGGTDGDAAGLGGGSAPPPAPCSTRSPNGPETIRSTRSAGTCGPSCPCNYYLVSQAAELVRFCFRCSTGRNHEVAVVRHGRSMGATPGALRDTEGPYQYIKGASTHRSTWNKPPY
jgi:hypothetical protein